jgi:hypothetical protein
MRVRACEETPVRMCAGMRERMCGQRCVTHDVRPVRREYRRASGTASGIASLAHGEMKWPNPAIGGHFGALLRGSGCGWLGFTEKGEPLKFHHLLFPS